MLDRLAAASPKLAEQLVPGAVSISALLRVLQDLLREHIPVKDFRGISEALILASAQSADPETLSSAVRAAIGRMIVQSIYGTADVLEVITLDPELEHLLAQAKSQGGADTPTLEPGLAERLQTSILQAAERQEVAGSPSVLLVSSAIRALLAKFVRYSAQPIHVLAFEEVPDNKQITVVATISKGDSS